MIWPAFEKTPSLLGLIPPLIVLQENMQMTLAARLSTSANLGHLDKRTRATSTLAGNMMLVQCQAIIFGIFVFLCSLAGDSLLSDETLNYGDSVLLCATCLITASLGNFLISLKIFVCVIIARKCCCNPDNIAVPLAGSENHFTTVVLVAWVSDYLHDANHGYVMNHVVISLYILLVIIFLVLANRNSHVSTVLKVGWVPILLSMIVAMVSGLTLELALDEWHGFALFYPIMSSTGVYLVGIHASRLTTYLSTATVGHLGTLPEGEEQICRNPIAVLCGKPHAPSVRVLLCLLPPAQTVFVFLIFRLKDLNFGMPSMMFLFLFLLSSSLQVKPYLFYSSSQSSYICPGNHPVLPLLHHHLPALVQRDRS